MAALNDPVGLIRSADQAIVDEIQRAPDLLRAIKMSVDDDRRPGRFLLTGSANVLALPQVSESLAGRMAVVDLLPLSPAEIGGTKPRFLQHAFEGRVVEPQRCLVGDELVQTVLTGGYPEMVRRTDEKRRQAWARDYLGTLLRRDVNSIAEVEKQQGMARLFRILTNHSAQLVNFSQVSGQVGIEVKASATVRAGDFNGLRKLAGVAGDDFRLGVVLHDGHRVLPFGDRLLAAPLSSLWMPATN